MPSLLTAVGLSTAAGLNAWIPLLAVGLLARYTDLVTLPQEWQWLGNGWIIAVLAALLAVELLADKIPGVDSANDIVQTLIRPTSGGLVFGAGSAADTVTVTDPATLAGDQRWVPIAVGVVIALAVHLAKSLARVGLNAATGCLAAPVVSTAENVATVALSLAALLLPVLVLGLLAALVAILWWGLRRRLRRAARSPAG